MRLKNLLDTRKAALPCGGQRPWAPHLKLSWRRDDGQSLVEFALCLPVLLLVVTGTFTFSIAMNNFLVLTDATNVGARQLAISRGQHTDPCAIVAATVAAAAPNLNASALAYSFALNGVSYTGPSCGSSSVTTGAPANLVQGGTARLTVTYPCNLRVYGANYAPACLLTAQTTELVQ